MNVHFHEQDLLYGIQSDLLKPKVKKKVFASPWNSSQRSGSGGSIWVLNRDR